VNARQGESLEGLQQSRLCFCRGNESHASTLAGAASQCRGNRQAEMSEGSNLQGLSQNIACPISSPLLGNYGYG
jgi:hypothetical protein